MPDLSVIIASVNDPAYLGNCLKALRSQRGSVKAEVIVVTPLQQARLSALCRMHPDVRFLFENRTRGIPELRAIGLREAAASVVAITEDHCIPADDWYLSIMRAHQQVLWSIIGGVVDNGAVGRLMDWAVYFCEYGSLASPLPEKNEVQPGAPNVSYRRDVLEPVGEVVGEEYWDYFLHRALLEKGVKLAMDSRIRVHHKMHFRFWGFLRERWHYGRAFAGRRNRDMPALRRVALSILFPVIPFLMTFRIARMALRRRNSLGLFFCCVPLIFLFQLAGSLGEFAGCAFGPGNSRLHLR